MTKIVDFAAVTNLPQMALSQAEALAESPALWAKRNGTWQATTWRQMQEQILALAGSLVALGLKPGDRVVLLSENRPEWGIADLAIMAAGGISVPAYITNTVADHTHILSNSGALFAFVSGPTLATNLLKAALTHQPDLQIISMEPLHLTQLSGAMPLLWQDALLKGAQHLSEVKARLAALTRSHTACLIYTSGTGGAPKGVMLSHGNIVSNCRGAMLLLSQLKLKDEVFLNFLPLSHAYEHMAGLMLPISIGAQIYYAESIDLLAANMQEARPTIMTAVPRLYETMRGRILRQLQRDGGLKAKLFFKAIDLGKKRILKQHQTVPEWLLNPLLDVLVRKKVKARFGGRLKALVSGGAALPHELGLFFAALGVRILQGYGQTEASPVISCSPPALIKLDTVGPPLDGVEVRLASDGEILVKGDNVMQGYWRDEEATKRAIPDGSWLHTGDIGEFDADGYIRITDRKKDIIVISGGDTISPQRLEGLLTLEPEINQAMVIGDGKSHLSALIYAEPDHQASVAQAVERVNKTLSNIEKIRKHALVPEAFTIQNGMLTPSLKIRRHVIKQIYAEMIAGL